MEKCYKVRIPGEQRSTAATTRALADSTDGKRVPAVGVGDVIEASWQPLVGVPEYGANPALKTLR